MTAPLIECRGATKSFGDLLAVDDVSFRLMPGEVLSILGASGCGKTTLLRIIAGFEGLDDGEVRLQAGLVSDSDHYVPPERRNVGMVFQEYALFPHLTVAENVAFGLHGMSKGEQRSRTQDALDLVRLNGYESRYPHELSGGQQQRVALARTLAPSPIAVLLDEPFSNLDAGMRLEVRQEVEAILRSKGVATIFVTHDREEAFAFADRVGVMSRGRLEQIDAPYALYQAPVSPEVARIVGDCDFLQGRGARQCRRDGIGQPTLHLRRRQAGGRHRVDAGGAPSRPETRIRRCRDMSRRGAGISRRRYDASCADSKWHGTKMPSA